MAFKTNWPPLSDVPGGKSVLLGSSRVLGAGADNRMRRRDEGFKNQAHRKAKPDPLYDQAHSKKPAKCYRPADFTDDAVAGIFICQAGKQAASALPASDRRFA